MRFFWGLLCVIWSVPLVAQTFDASETQLSFGTVGDVTSQRLTSAAAWDFGFAGIQIDGSLDRLDAQDPVGTARAILTTDAGARIRLGVSLAMTSDDGIEENVATLGLHALYLTPDLRLDGTLQFPDHIDETGAFSFSIQGEQMLTQRIMITTDLFRLSMDDELQDYYSVGLGAAYLLSEKLRLFGEGYLTAADTYVFEDKTFNAGLAYRLSPSAELEIRYIRRIEEDGDSSDGLSVLARLNLGAPHQSARLFQSGPNADRFAIGAY
jgi:hypothetical protein